MSPLCQPERRGWFAAVLTQGLGAPACVAVIYSFYDRAEAIRTLRLVQLVLKETTKGA